MCVPISRNAAKSDCPFLKATIGCLLGGAELCRGWKTVIACFKLMMAEDLVMF